MARSSEVEAEPLLDPGSARPEALGADVVDGPVEDKEPKIPPTVPYIIGNEFCERFSYYGQRAILALYLHEQLKFSEKDSTEIVHFFIVLCYLFPFLGAVISDSYTGKYKVILYLSGVYCLGNWLVSFSSLAVTGSEHSASLWALAGLGLVALGTGGIKPCVSAFGGDQIELTNPPGPARDRLLRWFFSYFYFAINLGSTFSMILVPILRANVSYFTAFALPAVLMMVAVLIFWLGRAKYVHQPPSGNVVVRVLSIIWYAKFGAGAGGAAPPRHQDPPPAIRPRQADSDGSGPSLPTVNEGQPSADSADRQPRQEDLVIKKLRRRGSKRAVLPHGAVVPPHWLDRAKGRYGEEAVEDVKQVLKVLLLFLPTPIFWSLWDQQSSRWIFQADKMDGRLPFGLSIYPDQMQTLNAVGILAMIPLFDQVIYPAAERAGVPVKPIGRMALGMLLGSLSFVLSALVQVWIDRCPFENANTLVEGVGGASAGAGFLSSLGNDAAMGVGRILLSGNGTLTSPAALAPSGPVRTACVSLAWQVPQYLVITAGEILFSITGLELAYSQSPNTMSSVVSAAWLITDATGNLFTVFVIGSISPLLSSQVQEFLFFAVMCIIAMLLLLWVGRGFTYVESCEDDGEEVPDAEAQALSQP